MLVVLTIPQRPRRSDLYRCRKLRSTARIELVIRRGTAQRDREVQVVGVTVAHDGEVRPVLQRIARERHLCRKHEVVVGPAQSLTPSERGSIELDILIWVVVALVVIIIVAVVTVEVRHVVVHVRAIIIGIRDVALLRVEGSHGELDGALVAEPVGAIARVERLVVAAVGLEVDAERLAVTNRHDASVFAILVEEVRHREVVEFQTDTSDDTRLSPTQRELYLVVRLLFEVPVDVNGAVVAIGLRHGSDLLRIEVSHRCQLASRTHEGIFREEVAGLGAEFASDNVLVEAVVTIDSYAADMSLRTFRDTHLQIDAVANDVHLDGVELIEQITVVPIGITHGVFILCESLVEVLLVVDVAFLHTENVGQSLYVAHPIGWIHRVAHPRDVADEVFLTLVHLHIDVDVLRVDVPHAVLDDDGIAEAVFVVFLDEFLLIFLPAIGRELL